MTDQLTSPAVEHITAHNRQADLVSRYDALLANPVDCVTWFKTLTPHDLDILVNAITGRKGARP